MEVEKFVAEVESNIKKYLPSRYQAAEVIKQEVKKNDGTKILELIVKQPDNGFTSTISMEQHYQRANEYNISLCDTCKMIAEFILENEIKIDIRFIRR